MIHLLKHKKHKYNHIARNTNTITQTKRPSILRQYAVSNVFSREGRREESEKKSPPVDLVNRTLFDSVKSVKEKILTSLDDIDLSEEMDNLSYEMRTQGNDDLAANIHEEVYNMGVPLEKIKRQLGLEEMAYSRDHQNFQDTSENVINIGMGGSLKIVTDIEKTWYFKVVSDIREKINVEKSKMRMKGDDKKVSYSGTSLKFYTLLDEKTLAVLVIQCVFNSVLKYSKFGIIELIKIVGEHIRSMVLLESFNPEMHKFYQQTYGKNKNHIIEFAEKNGVDDIFSRIDKTVRYNCIRFLISSVVNYKNIPDTFNLNAKVDQKFENIFYFKQVRRIWCIFASDEFMHYIDENLSKYTARNIKHYPMVVPPIPWTSPKSGGYLKYSIPMVRAYDLNFQVRPLETQKDNLYSVFMGLNILGGTAWKINTFVLDAMRDAIAQSGNIADIPSLHDDTLPDVGPEGRTREWYNAVSKVKRRNYNLNSLRSDLALKLDIALRFQDEPEIFFPHNMDFRGRVYPIPPHLNHMGADTSRGLLVFAKGKPLGEKGLWWLKVQVSNLMGNDKVTLEERVQFTEERMHEVYDSVDNTFTGQKWWLEADDPWQCLGTCHELVLAIRSGEPEKFLSHMPLRQDGTCNGLQHYAALGGDVMGAYSVNVLPSPKPRDVYSDVLNLVQKRVDTDAMSGVEIAQKIKDKLQRKIVKQTVMTSVYGVTFIGARQQIANALQDKYPELDDKTVVEGSIYIAQKTFDSLHEMFTGAKQIMDWLADSSNKIAKKNRLADWVTPLGLHVNQPYTKRLKEQIMDTTAGNNFRLATTNEIPSDARKHRTAFPPNFVHSLDSTHMMLTAIACHGSGLEFASVHDSYWTHAADVEVMNRTLRQQYINLYSRPILEQLKMYWEKQHPDINFDELPERGNFDLQEVKNSTFFFS